MFLLKKIFPNTHPLRLFAHKIMAIFASLIYWFPANKMIVIGVTGTKGKSTTTNFIASMLEKAGYNVGMTSTTGFQIASKKWVNDLKMTTLNPFKLNSLLSKMVKANCKYAVLEVSSISITQSRVWGVNFDIAVLTNINVDHIDYHGNFDSYLNAKASLFRSLIKSKRKSNVAKIMILNSDDEQYEFFNSFVADRKITYGFKDATISASNIVKKSGGSSFTVNLPNDSFEASLNVPGEFNVYNALASISVAVALNLPYVKVSEVFADVKGVPGRLEKIEAGQKYDVIVDYAHTEDSLEKVLSLYRSITDGKLFVVFGCTGGGRDKDKRPKMGEVAHKYADYIILTNDDPYEEDEMEIIEQISMGIPRKEGLNFWKIPNRRDAIRLSLFLASENDVVVVAGKGSEETIILKDGAHKWNDKQVIIELIKRKLRVNLK